MPLVVALGGEKQRLHGHTREPATWSQQLPLRSSVPDGHFKWFVQGCMEGRMENGRVSPPSPLDRLCPHRKHQLVMLWPVLRSQKTWLRQQCFGYETLKLPGALGSSPGMPLAWRQRLLLLVRDRGGTGWPLGNIELNAQLSTDARGREPLGKRGSYNWLEP